MAEPLTFGRLQKQAAEWADRQYLSGIPHQSLLGVVEEHGELAEALLGQMLVGKVAHAQLKTEDGIRGSAEEHAANAQDAIGDLTVFLSRFCERRGWDYQQIVEQTWAKVSQRDWKADPQSGGSSG